MKTLIKIINRLATCPLCHGLGYREMPNGDTKECGHCAGKGYK